MLKNRLWANPWFLLLVIAGLLAGLLAAAYFVADRPVTTVILVRHAEKNIEPNNPNPALTPAGQERAETLVRMIGESGITAIYATQYLRTQGTASPLADRLRLKVNHLDARNVEELVRQIKVNHLGGVVFVAGHSNSVPAVISALGGESLPEISEQEYDNMFIVTVQRFRKTRVLKLKYGNPSSGAVNQQVSNR